MRIAISGTHSLGKSTFVRDFHNNHPDYIYENEPYRELMHHHEILFGDHQTQHHINLQLNHCLAHTKLYSPGDKVIFDRCPIDFIPYADYTAQKGSTDIDATYVKSLYHNVTSCLHHLDLIVFVPMSDAYPITLEDDGHRPVEDIYQTWVDKGFKKLYREQLHTIMPEKDAPLVIEITGPREKRIALLEKAIEKQNNATPSV